jgi:hypothetical protein
MQYCKTIRRILAIDKALDRIPAHNYFYDDIAEALLIKREKLVLSLHEYRKEARGNKEQYINRRKQLILAANLLGTSYYNIMH